VEAIKIGLAIGAGTGGVFALLLAVRRQWHQELSAAATEHDAAERRVTELYTKAVEQLGSTQAPVRLGGLYALERVAQNNPEQRQTVVNVLCAYLRMPFTAPGTSPRRLGIRRPPRPQHPSRGPIQPPAPSITSAGAGREELEVRLAAQRILAKHLQPGTDPTHPAVTFSGARFAGIASFIRAQIAGVALFTEATFADDTSFTMARFAGHVSFAGTQFAGQVGFSETQFAEVAAFAGGRFGDRWVADARFKLGAPPEIAALVPEPAAEDDPDDEPTQRAPIRPMWPDNRTRHDEPHGRLLQGTRHAPH
jgi:hypothetical protein